MMIPYEQALGDSGKGKLSFDRKKPAAEPGSGTGSHKRGEGKKKKRREQRNKDKTHTMGGITQSAMPYKAI